MLGGLFNNEPRSHAAQKQLIAEYEKALVTAQLKAAGVINEKEVYRQQMKVVGISSTKDKQEVSNEK